jgi:hypothetical protein
VDDGTLRRLSEFLDRQEVADLVVKAHAITDRWEWEKLDALLTPDAVMETRIDSIPVFPNRTKDHDGYKESTNWRERTGVRGQHQWSNVVVTVSGDTAVVYMTGTQTNTFPDGYSETSGVLQEAVCQRTAEGWKIARMGGSYESNHARLDEIFADQLEGKVKGFRRLAAQPDPSGRTTPFSHGG